MIVSDVTSAALAAAVNGQTARLDAVADNLANLDTPGFRAGRVDFEASLAAALNSGGDPAAVTPTFSRSTAPGDLSGNNVSMDTEMVSATEALLGQQMAIRALNARYADIRTAIGAA